LLLENCRKAPASLLDVAVFASSRLPFERVRMKPASPLVETLFRASTFRFDSVSSTAASPPLANVFRSTWFLCDLSKRRFRSLLPMILLRTIRFPNDPRRYTPLASFVRIVLSDTTLPDDPDAMAMPSPACSSTRLRLMRLFQSAFESWIPAYSLPVTASRVTTLRCVPGFSQTP
jgi:hypothetical protein